MSKATSNGVPPRSVLHTYMINTSISHLEVKIKSLLIQFAVDIHIGRRHNQDDESRFQSWVQIKWLCDKAARHKAEHPRYVPVQSHGDHAVVAGWDRRLTGRKLHGCMITNSLRSAFSSTQRGGTPRGLLEPVLSQMKRGTLLQNAGLWKNGKGEGRQAVL